MNISEGQGDYNNLKPIIEKFRRVLITGPHGSGTKITTEVISTDFGLPYVRGENPWKPENYELPEIGLRWYHNNLVGKEYSMFAPSNSAKSLAVDTNTGCAKGRGLVTVSVG
jgi:hypothetical protein